MSKLVYLCSHIGKALAYDAGDLERVFDRLTPDNLMPRAPRIIEGEGVLVGIFNPVDALPIRDQSVCLGKLFEHREDWWQPGAQVPDGSYALFRWDGATLELVSDIVGSRTIWYAQTPDLFIASTSQRAIVCFLRNFHPNEAVYPWMLSSGSLGPGLSWDRRIRCLGPDSRLRLDRRSWDVSVGQRPVLFEPKALSPAEHERHLRDALDETFARLELDTAKWVLPLSGGYDSRAILLLLRHREGLKTVTWGVKSALADRQSDAGVARELARHFGLAHEYYETDFSDEPIDLILDRHLVAGEGRVDHVSGYMDGFAVWKRLYESRCQGVLRGDVAFGCRAVNRDCDVYRNMGLTVLSDFANLQPEQAGIQPGMQNRPEGLERRQDESREAWRDRVNLEFELPYILAALSDLKLCYVELIQPLMSRRIVEATRTLPDELRTAKALFRRIIKGLSPRIEYAKRPAIQSRGDILRSPGMSDLIHQRLRTLSDSPEHIAAISRYAVDLIRQDKGAKPQSCRTVSARLLSMIKNSAGLENDRKSILDPYQFGFRAYIIVRMNQILESDGETLSMSAREIAR